MHHLARSFPTSLRQPLVGMALGLMVLAGQTGALAQNAPNHAIANSGAQTVTASSLNLASTGYGQSITLAQADEAMAAADGYARAHGYSVAIAIVDTGGHLVAFRRMTGVGTAVADIAQGKARTAAAFRAPSADIEGWANGNPAPLAIPGIMPTRGGLPIVVSGLVIGGVGVSGVSSEQDENTSAAAIAALLD